MLLAHQKVNAQTDTEFWFVAPELTVGHNGGGSPAGGVPAFLRFATLNLPSTVTVSMPANRFNAVTNPTGFVDIVIDILANDTESVDLSDWIWQAGIGDVNRLENKNLTPNGVNPFGIRVQATNLITAYYEVSNLRNADIWSLKGRNALGKEFFTPFQTHGINGNYTPQPYSAIDIVATEDNTVVTIIARRPSSYGQPLTNVLAFVPITVTLQRGQTFSLFPLNKSQAVADRLVGTHITSTKPIAITLKDDSILHTAGGCRDVVGDQLVPVELLGLEYAVVRTFLSNSDRRDHVYVLAVEDGTEVSIDGVIFNLNQGEQAYRRFPDGIVTAPPMFWGVSSNKPVYVMHVGGFGCEQGMAILPPIDICTGSTQVAFTRSNDQAFFLTMMVRGGTGAEFGFLFNGVPRPDLIDPAAFVAVPNTDWMVARFKGALGFTLGEIGVGSHLVENTEDIFHLGIVNGGGGTTCFYGYFSDYNEIAVEAVVAGTSSIILKTCYGTPVQLFARGGTNFTWTSSPSDASLVGQTTSQMPLVTPLQNTQYTVTVSGACGITDDAIVNVLVSTPIDADFTTDVDEGCAPLTVTFTDESTGVYYWEYNFGDGNPFRLFDLDPSTVTVPVPPTPFEFTHTFENDTDLPIDYTITLLVRNEDFCNDVITKTIRVYPSIKADYTQTIVGGLCDLPREVEYNNNLSSNNTADEYFWDFGDGFTYKSNTHNETFSHLFNNLKELGVTYDVSMIAVSPFGCRDTAFSQVYVTSYHNPEFQVSKTIGCGPLPVTITNVSVGDTASYAWSITPDPGGSPLPLNGGDFTRTLPNTTETYIEYTIRLTITNVNNCVKWVERIVRVNPQVQVQFTTDPVDLVVCDSTMVNFTSSIIHPSLPNINYIWTFGDGAFAYEANPSHLFTNVESTPDPNQVSLVAVSEFGCIDTKSTTVVVYPRVRAIFTIDEPVVCSGEEITFNYLTLPSIQNYDFNFQGYADQLWPGHFNSLGEFTKTFINHTGAPIPVNVEYTVTNTHPSGCPKFYDLPLTVNPEVTASFSYDKSPNNLGCNPLTVTFNNTTSYTSSVIPFVGTYYWDFGDGTSSQEENPTHTFINTNPADSVTYTVTLTSTSVHGCVSIATTEIVVQPRLEALFTMNPGSVCSPTEVTFSPSSVGAERYLWDFDGIIPNEERINNDSFSHTFISSDPENTELRTITLTVLNIKGCTDVYSLDLTLYPLVISNFTASTVEGCSDLVVTFTNSSTGGGVMYNWDFDDGESFVTPLIDPITHTFSNRTSGVKVYNVKLLTVNASGCTSKDSVNITVYPKVEADFTFKYDSVCTPFFVTFENSSLNGNEYQWDFGHMAQARVTTNKDSFTQLFDNESANGILSYNIRLVALDNVTGCSDTVTKSIVVNPRVITAFEADVYSGCNPLEVQFANNSTGLGTYLWEFDDGTSSTEVSPKKIFSHTDRETSRDFNVKLTSTNPNGCKSAVEHVITVYPLVESNFTISGAFGCTPLTVQLNNSTVSSAYVYEWDFGDGQTSSTAQPTSVTYVNNLSPLNLFNPNIVLTTRYSLDPTCLAVSIKQITVYPHIYPDFSGDLEGCHPHPVTFANETDVFGGVASATYLWDFKNGTFSNEVNPQETFTNTSFTQDSLFDVMLKATSIHGCVDYISHQVVVHPNPRARIELLDDNISCSPFEVEFVNISEGVNLSYHYDFGDDADTLTLSANPMVHFFRNLTNEIQPYMTTLTAETEFGCTHQFFQTLWVYPEVKADFYFDPGAEHCNPAEVTMVNQSLNTWYYVWNFGDGSTSYLKDPFYTFLNLTTETKVFNVTLTANSEFDCEDSKPLPLTVYPQPIANFAIDPPLKIYPDADFLFTNQTQPASPNWIYKWDFDDGKAGSLEMHPGTYTYETWGPSEQAFQYFVTLQVENDNCKDQITHPLTLRPANPIALFKAEIYESCAPLSVQFINASSFGQSFLWDFGDGNTSTEEKPSHTFYNEGYYNVSLTVTGDGGSKTFFDVLRVYPKPIADFAVLPEIVVLPDDVASFYNLSKGANAYIWDFGDGQFSSLINPVHKYEKLGNYTVELIAYSNFFCSDTLTREAAVIVEGAGLLRFPNAFVPNKQGPSGGSYSPVDFSNQIFHPVHEGVIEYRLLIFNRWGEQIFQSDDVWIGWDGYYKGKLSALDVYVYRAVGRFSNGKSFDVRGNVTLLR